MLHPSSNPIRILLITRNLPPLVGGMERLHHHIFLELSKQYEVAVAGPIGCESYLHAGIQINTFHTSPKSIFVAQSIHTAWHLGKKFHPDLVVCGSGATSIAGLLIARRLKVPFITFLHGLDIVASHFLYRKLFLPAIRASDTVIAISKHTAKLCMEHGVSPEKIKILHPGVQMPTKDQLGTGDFRKKIGAPDKSILLSVGRIAERKGLIEFIINCMPDLVSSDPNIVFIIVGSEAQDALNANSGMLTKLNETITRMNLQSNVKLLGKLDENELIQAYNASQLFVFPVLDLPGDVEGFGMVAIEAAAHGLATVAFATGGVPDAVSDGVSGYLVEPGNYQKLTQTILKYLSNETTFNKVDCQQFASGFNWTSFGDKLNTIIKSTLTISHHDGK